jgi:hypothetical protein
MRNAAAAVALSILFAKEARATGERTSSLAWVRLPGAETCIAAPALAQRVEERLGRKVFVGASDADITLEGTIGPQSPSGYRASLRVTDRDGKVLGTREVETRSAKCDAIDTKLALVVSVLIDPDAEEAPPPAPVPPPEPPPPQVVEKERVVVVHEPAPEAPREGWRAEIAIGGTGTVGLQPNVGLGFAPEVAIFPPSFFAVLVSGGVSLPTDVPAERGATIEGSLAHGAIAFCPLRLDRGALRGLACAGALVGALRSRGVGFDTTASSSSLTAGPTASGRVSYAFAGPVVAIFGAGVVVPLAHAELAYRTTSGESSVFRTAAVAGTADLGIGVQLP